MNIFISNILNFSNEIKSIVCKHCSIIVFFCTHVSLFRKIILNIYIYININIYIYLNINIIILKLILQVYLYNFNKFCI